MLAGVDGHAGGYNSQALAQAQDEEGNVVGFNATTLAPGGVFEAFIPYVDLATGVVRDAARSAIAVPDTGVLSAEGEQAAAQYDKILPAISTLMASRGITGCRMPAPTTSSGVGCARCRTRICCTCASPPPPASNPG